MIVETVQSRDIFMPTRGQGGMIVPPDSDLGHKTNASVEMRIPRPIVGVAIATTGEYRTPSLQLKNSSHITIPNDDCVDQRVDTENVVIPNRIVGYIIGAGGGNIARIQRDSGTKIQIAPCNEGMASRICTIFGRRQAINRAKDVIIEIVQRGDTFMPTRGLGGIIGPPDSDMGDGTNASVEMKIPGPIVGFTIDEACNCNKSTKRKAEEYLDERDTKEHICFLENTSTSPVEYSPAKRMKADLDSSDKDVKFSPSISKKVQVLITPQCGKIDAEIQPGSQEWALGEDESDAKQAYVLTSSKIIFGTPTFQSNYSFNSTAHCSQGDTEIVQIPSQMVKIILGESGSRIHQLRRESGARIKIAHIKSHVIEDIPCTISGTREAVNRAKHMICQIMQGGDLFPLPKEEVCENLHPPVADMGDGGNFSLEMSIQESKVDPAIASQGDFGTSTFQLKNSSNNNSAHISGKDTAYILIPGKMVRKIGSRISNLRWMCGVKIGMAHSTGSGMADRFCTILGNREAVNKAKNMIFKLIRGGNTLHLPKRGRKVGEILAPTVADMEDCGKDSVKMSFQGSDVSLTTDSDVKPVPVPTASLGETGTPTTELNNFSTGTPSKDCVDPEMDTKEVLVPAKILQYDYDAKQASVPTASMEDSLTTPKLENLSHITLSHCSDDPGMDTKEVLVPDNMLGQNDGAEAIKEIKEDCEDIVIIKEEIEEFVTISESLQKVNSSKMSSEHLDVEEQIIKEENFTASSSSSASSIVSVSVENLKDSDSSNDSTIEYISISSSSDDEEDTKSPAESYGAPGPMRSELKEIEEADDSAGNNYSIDDDKNEPSNILHSEKHVPKTSKKCTVPKPYKCKQCDYASFVIEDMPQHFLIHAGQKSYHCELCNYKCNSKEILVTHSRTTHTGGKQYQCEICFYECSTKERLSAHSRTHTGEKRFHCEWCDYKCHKKGSMDLHVKIHEGEKLYSCPFCNFKCSAIEDVTKHFSAHPTNFHAHPKKPFHCAMCDFDCNKNEDLVKHLRTHREKETYKCEYCDFHTIYKGNLVTHVQTHTEEKPHECKFCDFKCNSKEDFLSHVRVHTGEPPYRCEFCDYKCNHKEYLVKHAQIHVGKETYKKTLGSPK